MSLLTKTPTLRTKTRLGIGKRLRLAFLASSALTLLVALVSIVAWNHLDNQANEILNQNLPTIRSSIKLEQLSKHLAASVVTLTKAGNESERTASWKTIKGELIQLRLLLSQLAAHQGSQSELTLQLDDFVASAGKLNLKVQNYLEIKGKSRQLIERLQWSHSDFNDESTPLQQDLRWQMTTLLEQYLTEQTIARRNSLKGQLGLLDNRVASMQQLVSGELSLMGMFNETYAQRHHIDLSSSFRYLDFEANKLREQAKALQTFPSSVSLRQILTEMLDLIGSKQEIYLVIRQELTTEKQIEQIESQVHNQLKRLDSQVTRLITTSNDRIGKLMTLFNQISTTGEIGIFSVSAISLLLSIWLAFHYVGSQIVGRLSELGDSMSRISGGQLNTRVMVSGRDEIGALAHSLRQCQQTMLEIERTNALELLNKTATSLILCDANGQVLSLNPSASHLLGNKHGPAEAKDKLWRYFNQQAEVQIMTLFTRKFQLENLEQASTQLNHTVQDGNKLYLRLDLRRFYQREQLWVMVTITDISEQIKNTQWLQERVDEQTQTLQQRNRQLKAEIVERQRAEDKLKKAQNELIQSAKMAVVGQTMTSLAHELNQPLNALTTYQYSSQMWLKKNATAKVAECLTKSEQVTARMSRIIKNLRSFAKKDQSGGGIAATDLCLAVKHATELMQSKLNKRHVQLIYDLPVQQWVQAEPSRLEQVLVNLLANAVDAIERQKEPSVNIWLESNQEVSRLFIEDNGPGFSEKIIENLFTPFATTKEVGLGLGMHISRSLVEQFGGQLHVASSLQGSAQLIIELATSQTGDLETASFSEGQ